MTPKPSVGAGNAAPFDFLRTYIETLLDQSGFAEVSEAARAQYVPQFVAEAERRLGLALLPKLSEGAAKELVKLAEAEDTTPDALQEFWQTNVSDFSAIVEKTLADFANELKNVVKNLGSSS